MFGCVFSLEDEVKTFLIGDPHFGHFGVCKFLNGDGTKLRPWDHPDLMDEALVDNWNSVVSPKDKVYVLGDVCINRKAIPTVGRCNGRKILIKGNHDLFKLSDYVDYFDDIRAYWPLAGMIMSHIPIHPESLSRWTKNIHGHLHSRRVMLNRSTEAIVDPRYICVSVEHINFTPIDLQRIIDEDFK